MRTSLLAGAAIAVMGVALAAPASAVQPGKAELFVLHGVPELTVDVYVNGALTLDDFTPGTLAGPLDLDPGTYAVALTASDAADASAPLLGPVDLTLAAGSSYTAVAHLTEAGAPTASLFTNDISPTAAGEGRLTVRHVAAAPAVDILVGGSALFSNLANPDEAKGDVPAGTYAATVAATGDTAPVIGPADVPIVAGQNTIVYAWGSLADDSLALAVQPLAVTTGTPSGVAAGTQGLADEGGSVNYGMWLAIAGLVSAMGVGTVVAARRS